MAARLVAALAGLAGGACWLAVALAGGDLWHWAGLVLLAVALAAAGARLVRARWLQLLVAVAFPLLVWSVLEVVRDAADDTSLVDGVVGAAAVVLAVLALVGLARGRAASRAAAASAARAEAARPGTRRADHRADHRAGHRADRRADRRERGARSA